MKKLLYLTAIIILVGCSNNKSMSDAYGNFEADEIIISAEIAGRIIQFDIEEGQTYPAGKLIGFSDTLQLHYSLEQIIARKKSVEQKISSIEIQAEASDKQAEIMLKEKSRLSRLLKDSAATSKQFDDVSGNIEVIEKQARGIRSQSTSLQSEALALTKQVEQLQDQIKRCYFIMPETATVLEKYIHAHEMVLSGKSLFKIANMDYLVLKAYVSGQQLPNIIQGDSVHVFIDKDAKINSTIKGIVARISSQAEFTPKIIQTKEERVNLVYAIEIKVKNDGRLKIGMPGEVLFNGDSQEK